MPRLDWGNYQVNIDQHIVFTISVVKEIVDSPSINNNPNRLEYAVVTLCFLTGDLPELQHRMSAWSRQKETNSVGRMVFDYNLEMHLSSICLHLAKGDPAAFRGYYYRRLPELRTWLDQLMAPRPIAETSLLPIQINLLFYGPSGTGKTALARRLAEYTNRDLYLLDLTQIADKVGLYQALYPYSASSKILLLDELDKTLTTLEAIRQRRERRDQLALEMLTAIGPNREEERADKPAKKKKVEPEWVLDDLLGILCGAHVPHGRMVIATANDLDTISTLCPYLVRPGRLTPMAFEYGTADEFLAIVKEALSNGTTAAADLDNDTFHAWKRLESDIPKDYRFVQANLLEYLHSHPKVTVSELLRLLPEFKAPNPGT
jgi:Cdc6-like AAA superfamily ATPase